MAGEPVVCFETDPSQYRHLRLEIDGEIARIVLAVDEQGGISPGYELKLNSYDLGVDIELHDAVQRLRFEHPQVRAVVITSGLDKVFCAGANIRMLAQAGHAWKVNFCKFTNETRNAIEDAGSDSGQAYLAAVNGNAAGGGYELALACDEIIMVDDGSATVSLPEVPLLAVLPGTGGLTRLVDKRGVRKDLADVVATRSEGVRAKTALAWGLVDEVAPPSKFPAAVDRRAHAAARLSRRGPGGPGIALTPTGRYVSDDAVTYPHVTADLDRGAGLVTITVRGPQERAPRDMAGARDRGAAFWPLAVVRELDDLILWLRTNETGLGTWVIKTSGEAREVLDYERLVAGALHQDWLADEVRHYAKRTLARLDVTSRSLFALIEPGSCFAGTLLELAFACDRQFMLYGLRDAGVHPPSDGAAAKPAAIVLSAANFGALPMATGMSRLASRFNGDPGAAARLKSHANRPIEAAEALELGLVTFAPDDLDWDDEIRIACEERASLSPDALTAMEANLRFAGPETPETKIFGRLSAWQNWVFTRPNASGPEGALRRYGTGQAGVFNRERA
jgi:benzoyl-CoA-dihydrodiol lyase